jgi:hypothetical protein
MKIKFATWNSFWWALWSLGILWVVLNEIRPKWWSSTVSITAFVGISLTIAIPVFLFWTGIGKIRLQFAKKDEQKVAYKLWKSFCDRSGRSLIDGSKLPGGEE